jgi:hypothetical protein
MADMVPAGNTVIVDPGDVSFEEESAAADRAAAAKDAAGGRREVGDQDQVWSLSTAKPGNGVEQLRDGDLETYWQCVAPSPRSHRSFSRPPLAGSG